jgi:cytochrome c6
MNRSLILTVTICGAVGVSFLQIAHAGAPAAGPAGDAKRGEKLFSKKSCAECHPGGGNVLNPKDPLKGPKFAREFNTDAKIEKVIRSGINGTPMPPFSKEMIKDQELKDIIAYIRTLTPKSGK